MGNGQNTEDGKQRRLAHIAGRRPRVTDLPPERDVEREIEIHVAQLTDELMAEGWSPEDARREALERFGDRHEIETACRAETRRKDRRLHLGNVLSTLVFDLRFGLRQLIRNPGLSLVIVLTLAIGIGPTVAIFSAVKALIFDPFPYPEADRLVEVWSDAIGNRWGNPASMPDYADLREQNTTFEEMGLYTTVSVNFSAQQADLINGIAGTASLLEVFGVQPALGRWFTVSEEAPGRDQVIILTNGLWRRRFDADPDLIGRTVRINGDGYEVIGIMPAGFEILSPWYRGQALEFIVPIAVDRDESRRDSHSWLIAGRLLPGVSVAAAEADVQAIAARLAELYPGSNARDTFWLQPFAQVAARGGLQQLSLFFYISALVLLAACTNVAGILLARGAGRRSEVAIRTSLGASRRRIVGQLLVESLLFAVIAGGAGIVLALWSRDLLLTLLPDTMQRTAGIGIDSGVLFFALGLSVLTGLFFGLGPARIASRTEVASVLREGALSRTSGRVRNRALRRLTVAQLAIALMLANGAIILVQSRSNLDRVPLGYDEDEVLTAEVWLGGERYAEDSAKVAFCEELIARLEERPGIQRAAVTNKLPMQGGTSCTILVGDEVYEPETQRSHIEVSYVTPGYFETLGIDLLAGRDLQRDDGLTLLSDRTRANVVVNRVLAEGYWPGENAIGRVVRYNGDPSRWSAVIVGVVEGTRQWGPQYGISGEMYFPYPFNPWMRFQLAVRTNGDPMALVPEVRAVLGDLDPDLALSQVGTMGDVTAERTRNLHIVALLVNLFGIIALTLAMIGVYGVMSYSVARRRHELGIRSALGAGREYLVRLVVRQAVQLVAVAIGLGTLATIAGGIIFRSLVFGIGMLHWLYALVGAGIVVVLTLAAASLPAWRAAGVDPVEALRTD